MLGLVVALLLSVETLPEARPADGALAGDLQLALETLRSRRKLPPLDRPEALRRLAERRAGQIAAAPVARRLPHPVPLDDELDDRPEFENWRIHERVVLVPPAITGTERVRAAWDNPEAGALALDPESIAVGLGAWIAPDGTLVLVALFRAAEIISDRDELEDLIVEAINDVRVTHGMTALRVNPRLRFVARAHSEAMLEDDVLAHASSDGSMPADRVRAAQIPFKLVGENVAQSQRPLGAVHGVIDEWMASPGHRGNILTPDFRETAVGAAIAPDGSFYLTQLFVEP